MLAIKMPKAWPVFASEFNRQLGVQFLKESILFRVSGLFDLSNS